MPRHFLAGLSPAELTIVNGWWSSLVTRDRRYLTTLSDSRADSCSYNRAPRPRGSSAWYGLAVEVQGHFIDDGFTDAPRDGHPEDDYAPFPIDLYEYLVNHEITLSSGETYHVCTRHQAAAEVVRAGTIPATFSCPLRQPHCPMRRLLAVEPGRSLSLRLQLHSIISKIDRSGRSTIKSSDDHVCPSSISHQARSLAPEPGHAWRNAASG